MPADVIFIAVTQIDPGGSWNSAAGVANCTVAIALHVNTLQCHAGIPGCRNGNRALGKRQSGASTRVVAEGGWVIRGGINADLAPKFDRLTIHGFGLQYGASAPAHDTVAWITGFPGILRSTGKQCTVLNPFSGSRN